MPVVRCAVNVDTIDNNLPGRDKVPHKLQALVYDILPSTTAVFIYAIAWVPENRQLTSSFFIGAQTLSSKFVTNNSNYIRRLFYVAMLLTPAQIKPKSPFESARNSFFHTHGGCVSCKYVRASALGCFHSLTSIQTFRRRALTASVDSCAEIKSAPSVA